MGKYRDAFSRTLSVQRTTSSVCTLTVSPGPLCDDLLPGASAGSEWTALWFSVTSTRVCIISYELLSVVIVSWDWGESLLFSGVIIHLLSQAMSKFTSFINKVVTPLMRRTQKILRPHELTPWAMKGSAQWLSLREEQFSKGTLKELNKIQGQADGCSTPVFRRQSKQTNKQKNLLPSVLAASVRPSHLPNSKP